MRDDVVEMLKDYAERRREWEEWRFWLKEHESYLTEQLSPGSLLRLKVQPSTEIEVILTRLGVPFTRWVPPPEYFAPGVKRADLIAASKTFPHCSTRDEVIEVLKSVVEGRLEGITWRPWFNAHESLLQQLLSPGSCLRLKHYPVAESERVLAGLGVSFVASDSLEWLEMGSRSGRCRYCGDIVGRGNYWVVCPNGCFSALGHAGRDDVAAL